MTAERYYDDVMDQAIEQVAKALSDENRAKFLGSSREKQEIIVKRMMDRGIITWKIGGA